jgi:hypothetical protein
MAKRKRLKMESSSRKKKHNGILKKKTKKNTPCDDSVTYDGEK